MKNRYNLRARNLANEIQEDIVDFDLTCREKREIAQLFFRACRLAFLEGVKLGRHHKDKEAHRLFWENYDTSNEHQESKSV